MNKLLNVFFLSPINPVWWGLKHRFKSQLLMFFMALCSVCSGILMIALGLCILFQNPILSLSLADKLIFWITAIVFTYLPNALVILSDELHLVNLDD